MVGLKQVIVIREDLEMSKGKMISQCCHASLKAYKKASTELRSDWESEGAKKVILAAEEDLESMYRMTQEADLPAALVTDAGLTEVAPGTKTALGIGPADSSKIDTITGQLRLVK